MRETAPEHTAAHPPTTSASRRRRLLGLLLLVLLLGAVILAVGIAVLAGRGADEALPAPTSSASPSPRGSPTRSAPPSPASAPATTGPTAPPMAPPAPAPAPPAPPAPAPPAPPAPAPGASIDFFTVSPSVVYCNTSAPVPPMLTVRFAWSSRNATRVGFGVATDDALAAGMGWNLPPSGASESDFPPGSGDVPFPCPAASQSFTLTVEGSAGRVSQSVTVTNKGDL